MQSLSHTQVSLPSPTSRGGADTLLAIIFRRRRVMLICFAVLSLAILLKIVATPPQYESEMKILMERERYDPFVTSTTQPDSAASPDLARLTEQEINSEVDLLQSRDLLEKVVLACRLHERQSWWRALLPASDPQKRVAHAVENLRRDLDVDPPNKSSLVTLRYVSRDPQLSAQVLQALGEAYMQKHLEVHRPSGKYTFFNQEVEQNRDRLHQIQAKLLDFDKNEGVISAETEKAKLLDKIAEFDTTLQTTRAAASATEEQIRSLQAQLAKTPPRRTTTVRSSTKLLEDMKSALFNLELQRTQLLTKYDPSYRAVQDLDKQIAEARAAVTRAEAAPPTEQTTDDDPVYGLLSSELAKSKAELAGLQAKIGATARSLNQYRTQAESLNGKAVQQQELMRTAEVASDIYISSLRKQEDARMSQALDRQHIVNVTVAEAAAIPVLPKRSLATSLVLGFLLALVLSFSTGFAAEFFDPMLRAPGETARLLNVPVVALTAYQPEANGNGKN